MAYVSPPPQHDESQTSSDSGDEAVQEDAHMNGVSPTSSPRATESIGLSTTSEEAPQPSTMTLPSARAYQLEMLEESLKRNVIVAMDTGSGKTRVALMRIIEELERSPKRVWFLAPTVDLATQQYDVLRSQIIQTKLICGADNVQAWSSQQIWDALLLNVRVVVSTYQILFDAVQHSFVRLDSLSLIVIDEAHNCVGANAAARLMKEFYAEAKKNNKSVPHIMGLTASPLMRQDLKGIDILENTLDAVCKTPTKHRDELLAQVKRPEIFTITYGDPDSPERFTPTRAMFSLRRAYLELDIRRDPYILQLLSRRNTKRNHEEIQRAVMQNDTYSQKQMKSFYARATEIGKQVGLWAADYYIHRVITEFANSLTVTDLLLEGWSEQERLYLWEAFLKVEIPSSLGEPHDLSRKMNALINILQQDRKDPMGIVFVKERATVAVVAHVLAVHPLTRGRYRVGCVVGSSTMPGRRRDFLDLSRKDDLLSLERFRSKKFNLLVATSVLEEGIDVPICNLVICFDEVTSPKAFIQRRGRARMTTSQLYLLVEDMGTKSATMWLDFEQKMKARYEDEERERHVMEEIEESELGLAEYEVLVVEDTGARLTIRDAKGHLQHFCASLASRKFTDWSPYYVFHDTNTQSIPMRATVHLPASLDPSLRRFESLHVWTSEKNAAMDAAFQAYKALYKAGLISKNLLPLSDKDIFGEIEHREGFSLVGEQFNPWYQVAEAWGRVNEDKGKLYKRNLAIFSNNNPSLRAEFDLVLPVLIPDMEPLHLWWDRTSTWTIEMSHEMDVLSPHHQPSKYFAAAPDDTSALLAYSFGYRIRSKPIDDKKQYPFRLVSLSGDISISDMGSLEFDPSHSLSSPLLPSHLIRDLSDYFHPYTYLQTLPQKPPPEQVGRPYSGFDLAPPDIPYVSLQKWPRKVGFFRQPGSASQPEPLANSKPYPRVLPASQVKIDSIPSVYTHVGMLLPALTKALEIHLIAADLTEGPLQELNIPPHDLSQIVTAICSTSARAPTDYERIEFLGDSILKFCATVHASSKNLLWPEGYLSLFKDRIVSNVNLASAAVKFGLDKYIIYKPFTLQRWKPMYVEDLLVQGPPNLADPKARRTLPTKTLADVVESIIGVAFILGGYPKALECISCFLPKENWTRIELGREILYNNAMSGLPLPVTFEKLEELVGYEFTKKSLLVEAMTHCSFNGATGGTTGVESIPCLDRMEFLGDSILDYVVVRRLFALPTTAESTGRGERGLENSEMHLLRTSLVNGDVLAFLVMEWAVEEEIFEVTDDSSSPSSSGSEDEGRGQGKRPATAPAAEKGQVHLSSRKIKIPFWSFMRHSSPDMGVIHSQTAQRHALLRNKINEALFGEQDHGQEQDGAQDESEGGNYPWELLLRLGAQKFYSDLFESLLGAIWVDSGSIEECEKVVERIGIFKLLRRLTSGKVHCLHPKEELGRLAMSERVVYEVEEVLPGSAVNGNGKEGEVNEEGEERTFQCWVRVGDRGVAHVTGALSKEEARVMGAREACRILKGGMEMDVGE